MNNRRKLIIALGAGALAAPLACFAQQQGKVWRIGFLANGSRPSSLESHILSEFPRGLRELGYVEGKNIAIEWRFAGGEPAVFAAQAAELVRLKVDVIVAMTYTGIDAARGATNTIPIVMVAMGDPVKVGLVASLSRPGGNITGLSNLSGDVSVKYLELLRVAIPGLSRVAVWLNPNSAPWRIYFAQIEAAAAKIGMKVLPVKAQSRAEIEAGFGVVKRERAGAIIVTPNSLFSAQSSFIAQLAITHRLPTLFWTREHVEGGGFMSYGQNNAEHYYRAATYVDKILKGAKPGNLPVEQPTRLELVINRKTAQAIGLAISPELFLRADKVIE